MVHWMVALDDSSDSFTALSDTLELMDKSKDTLSIISVSERVYEKYALAPGAYPVVFDTQRALEQETKRRLKQVGQFCTSRGVGYVNYTTINSVQYNTNAYFVTALHVGDMVKCTISIY
jgi:hypothetical protein